MIGRGRGEKCVAAERFVLDERLMIIREYQFASLCIKTLGPSRTARRRAGPKRMYADCELCFHCRRSEFLRHAEERFSFQVRSEMMRAQ